MESGVGRRSEEPVFLLVKAEGGALIVVAPVGRLPRPEALLTPRLSLHFQR